MNRKSLENERLGLLVLPILFGAIMVVLLQTKVVHGVFGLKELQLPLPSQVAEAFFQRLSDICTDMGITLLPAVLGMILGGLIGYGTALLAVRFPRGGYGSLILMTAINSIPVVALATVMNRWFDSALVSKTAVAVVLTMGIMTVNAYKGLCDLRPFALDLMRTYGAEKRAVFWKLRIPASLPDVFTALKLGSTTAMMATIISEFFASETAGSRIYDQVFSACGKSESSWLGIYSSCNDPESGIVRHRMPAGTVFPPMACGDKKKIKKRMIEKERRRTNL